MNICQSDTRLFSIQTPLVGYNYNWTIVSNTTPSIFTPNGTSTNIFFPNAGSYTVTATGSNGTTTNICNKVVVVTPTPAPSVTYDKVVGCQNSIPPIDNYMPEDGNCINFCAGSAVTFTASSTAGNIGSTFTWVVSGGTATSYTVNPITVTFNSSPGPASIKVIETNNGCETEKTYCINLINKPIANMLTNLNLSGQCYNICAGQVVNFGDASIANGGTPITSWVWDFGDGTTYIGNVGSQVPPPHLYAPGTYTATLIVVNACNCNSEKSSACFNVDVRQSPPIFCTRAVCSGGRDIYCTNEDCTSYTWSVLGGSIYVGGINVGNIYISTPATANAANECDKCIEVQWNTTTADGFGYISLTASGCLSNCGNPNVVKIPIIGAISLPNITACAGDQVPIALPQWPATNFTWSLVGMPPGVILTPLTNGNTGLVEVFNSASANTVKVKIDYLNTLKGCVGSLFQEINITPKPVLIAPNGNLYCNNAAIVFTLSSLPTGLAGTSGQFQIIGPSGYTVSTAVSLASAGLSYIVTLPASFVTAVGAYIVTFSHPSFCISNEVTFSILAPPAPFTSITGTDLVCDGFPYTYTANNPMASTIANWAVTPAAAAVLGATGNTNTINWTMGANANAIINLTRSWNDLPNCKSAPISMIVNKIIPIFTLSPIATSVINVCENSTATYSVSVNQGSSTGLALTPEVYKWYLSNTDKGSISAGQGTAQAQVSWNKLIGISTLTLKCDVTICGVVTTSTFSINILGAPVIGAITAAPASPQCSGVPVVLTTTAVAGCTYSWAFSNGTVPTSGGTTNAAGCTFTNFTNAAQTVTYTVTCTNACGSTSTASASYTVNPQPNSMISPTGPIGVCTGASFSHVLTITTGNGAPTFVWRFDEVGAPPLKVITAATASTFTAVNTPLPIVVPAATSAFGAYSAIATLAGCTTLVGPVLINSVVCGPICTPLAPAGNNSISTTNTACLQAIGNAVIKGSFTSNIFAGGISWSSTGAYTTSGLMSNVSTGIGAAAIVTSTSPTYIYNTPGIYTITASVNYRDNANTALVCNKAFSKEVTIRIKANADLTLVCNGTNNGYTLVCKNTSALLPGFSLTSTNWTLNGTSVSTATNFTIATGLTPGQTYTIGLTAASGAGAGNTCSATYTVTIPALPVANYTASTTHPGANNAISCHNREILLTNTSTNPSSIVWAEWTFTGGVKNNTKSIPPYTAVNKQLGYVPQNGGAFAVNQTYTLTIKDAAGCTATSSLSFSIKPNTISASNISYNPLPQNICIGNLSSPINKDVLSLGSSLAPHIFTWKNLTTFVGTSATNSYVTPLNMSGSFWVNVIDANGCYNNFIPNLAKVVYQQPISISIKTKTNVCLPDIVNLTAINAGSSAGVTYTWACSYSGGSYSLTAGSSTTDAPSVAGSYTYTCVASAAGQCAGTASIIVTVLPPAPVPVLEIASVTCQPFTAALAVSNVQALGQYNWSNGLVGATTTVATDDYFRCWYADPNGCRSQADIYVPASPDQYLWRMPYGCERMCREYLPVHIDGPDFVNFDTWVWQYNGSTIPSNGPYATNGSNSTCDPLYVGSIGSAPPGLGSGAYSWQLGIPYPISSGMVPCVVTSAPWDLQEIACCSVPMVVNSNVIVGNNLGYNVVVTPVMGTCNTVSYQILILDGSNTQVGATIPMGTIPNNVPSNLTGNITIAATAVPPLTMLIKYTCLDCVNGVIECNSSAPLTPPGNKQAKPATPFIANTAWQCLPNPAQNQVTISYMLAQPLANATSFALQTMQGATIMQQSITAYKGSIVWPTSMLADGLYQVVQLQGNTIVARQKLMIAH